MDFLKDINKIVIFGCGNMGEAIVSSWIDQGIEKKNLHVFDPNPSKWLESYKKEGLNLNQNIPTDVDLCLIAVKPQNLKSIFNDLKKLDFNKTLFLSIVAGKKFNFFEENLDKNIRLIRIMPNTPVKVKKGTTAIVGNLNTNTRDIFLVEKMFNSIGETIKIGNEELMDIFTAISGSGPAYIFYIIEELTKIGNEYGLSYNDAKVISINTIIGSALLARNTEVPLNDLIINVTSPGGTTEAALEVFTDKEEGFSPLIRKTIEKAFLKSKKIGLGKI